MHYSAIAIVVASVGLAGCAAQQQRALVQQTTSCLEAAYNSPEAAPIRPRTPFNPNDASLAQLGDPAVVSKPEMDAISLVYPRVQDCDRQFLARLEKLGPAFVPLFAGTYRDNDNDAVALLQRRLTWGEFNQRRRDRAIASSEKLQVAEQQLAAENQARANAMIQGLAAAAAISQASQPVQPRARFTTCTQQGIFTNCIQQ